MMLTVSRRPSGPSNAAASNTTGDSGSACRGLKEVLLTIEHARYLKWLFLNAKFLFLYRDVYKGYLGLRRRPWVNVWPDYTVRAAPACRCCCRSEGIAGDLRERLGYT